MQSAHCSASRASRTIYSHGPREDRMASAKRYFEFVEGTSSKFWEVWSDGSTVYTRYGKIGSDGQTTMKDQGSAEGAKKLHDKLVKEKTGKGYEEKTAGGGGGD